VADLLFALAVVVPPIVVIVCFALLALPVRREVAAVPDGNPARSGPGSPFLHETAAVSPLRR
jgi:hypothetical protein